MSTLSAQHRLEQRLRGVARQQIRPKDGSGPWPLSFSQHGLWLLQQSDPDSGYYNMARVLRLEGILDLGALERALSEIVRRHAALRTTIESPNGTPIQVVQPFRNLPLNIQEPVDEQDCRASIQAFSGRAFKLDSELPFRYILYRVGQNVHDLVLAFHHVAVDGWTLRLLLGELGRLYSSFAKGQPSEEPELPLDYLDFAVWQRALVVSDKVEAQYDFWSKHLQGVPGMLALPLDRLRPARPSHTGAEEHVAIPAGTVTRLRELTKSTRITAFAVLLSTLEILLARYSRQQDFVIGTPVAGRTRPELEALIGCFVNTLFLRSSLEGDPSFSELIQRVSMVVNDAAANQDIPFELLMERLPRDHAQTPPKLQVLFAQQLSSEREIEMAGLQCSVGRPSRLTSRCDLTIFATDRGSAIDLAIEYDTDLFDAETIRRFSAHYCVLLDSAVSHPEAPVSQIAMLPQEETQLLSQFNRTTRSYPSEPVHVLFERQAAATPDAVAIVDGARRLTYGQLNAATNRVANYLRLQLKPGDLVAVSLPRTAHLAAVLLGIWKAGAAWVPLDPDEPRVRARKVLADSGATLLLAEKISPWQDLPLPAVTIDDALAHPDESSPPVCGNPDHLAYVMYTSGSTGQPKGVEIAHRGIVRLVSSTDYVGFGPGETFLAAAPVTFDASTFELWGALLHGSKCVLYPGRVPEPRELQRLVQREGITTLWLTSSLFNAIVEEDPQCLKGIRQLLVGGEALSVKHVRRAMAALPETQLINGYGPTENTTFTCCWPIPPTLPERLTSVPVGSPIANTRVYVLDERRELCGIDIPGEIYIGGDGLALGYRNSPGLTGERFITAPWGERLYRSGDLGRWRNDGVIEFLGRTDSQLKIRGFRIEPAEIEAALSEHPQVESAFVVPLEGITGERRLAAYIKPRGDAPLTETQIRAHLFDRLPAFLLPSWYCFVNDIPRNANGKRDATGLPLPQSSPGPEGRAPSGATEHRLMEIARGLLPDVKLGVSTNLFDAGMHSLLLARLTAQIGRVFGHTLQLSDLYANPTVEGIAAVIDAGSHSKDPEAPTPFFFAHAGPMFRHLAARMRDRPFYGVGFSAPGPPPRTIEEHARNEAAAIVRIHPQGPYLIGGWSASGVLAVEIARQLAEQGHDVALVVLFDAPNYAYFKHSPLRVRAARWLSSLYCSVRHHVSALLKQPAEKRVPYLRDRIWALRWASRQVVAEAQYRRDAASVSRMDESRLFVAAARHHMPAPYSGRVLLLRRRERGNEWGDSWDLGWKSVVSDLEIQTIGGHHMSIFEEAHVDALSAMLRERFEEATRLPKSQVI